ncbi:MAG: hypothetical protein ACOYKA_00815 [Legionellaceae bacterium]
MPSKSRRSIKPNFLFQYSIKEIHQAILKCAENKIALARHLNTSDTMTLPTHLGKFLFNGRPLTIERLKQLSVEEAALHMGEYYDAVLPERQPRIARYSPTYLHQICSSADTIRSAAVLLGIRDHTLSRYLSAVTHKVHGKTIHLTFDTFRSLSPEDVLACFAHQKPKHHASFHPLPHERFNLTPDIPEDLSAPITMNAHEVSPPEPTIALASHKRKNPSVLATEDYILTALSMFTQTSLTRETLGQYDLRPRKRRAEDPGFICAPDFDMDLLDFDKPPVI